MQYGWIDSRSPLADFVQYHKGYLLIEQLPCGHWSVEGRDDENATEEQKAESRERMKRYQEIHMKECSYITSKNE